MKDRKGFGKNTKGIGTNMATRIPFFSAVMPCLAKPKGRPRFSRWGGAYTPKTTRDFEKQVSDWATQIMSVRKDSKPLQPEFPIRVVLSFYIARPKSNKSKHHIQTPDVDNLAKGVLDAINGIVFTDDKQIITLELSKYWADYVEPSFAITIYQLPK